MKNSLIERIFQANIFLMKFIRLFARIFQIVIAILLLIILTCVVFIPEFRASLNFNVFASSIVLLALIPVMEYLVQSITDTLKGSEYRNYLVSNLSNNNTSKESPKINKDIFALMLKNDDEITEYFKISKSHVRLSFLLSVISCIIGISILCVSIYMIFVINNLQSAVISIISGAIIEVISGTVLWVHNKSILQLNHYYDALHENEKFLATLKIVELLSADKKDEMYMEIIRKQIDSATNTDTKNQDSNNKDKT